jgi:hypothetical protein
MAKTKARPTKSASKKKQALVARVPKSIVRLDEAALKWRKLLEDPCGADLAPPCYAGTGTGYLVRYRTLVNLPPTAVDFLWEFVPSEGPSTCLHNTWSATAGGSLGTAGTSSIGGILDNRLIVGRARCVAACVKVVYLGTELNRSGTVGFTCDSGASLLGGEAVIGNATEWMAGMPHTERIGSREAEYRWVPGPGDEFFRVQSSDAEEAATYEQNGNSLQVVINNAPAGTCQLQLVSVWEWQPAEEVTGYSRLVVSNRGPPSSASLNDVLRSLGDLGEFAKDGFKRAGSALAMRGIQYAKNTLMSTMGAAMLAL